MIDHLFWLCEMEYRQAVRALAAGDNERALIAFHQGLDALLRWRLVHDGADLVTAIDPARVGWSDLLLFLDAPYGVPAPERTFLGEMAARYQQVAEGEHPELPPALMGHYAEEIRRLYGRFYTRDPPQRPVAAMRAAYGRPRPADAAPPPTPAALLAPAAPAAPATLSVPVPGPAPVEAPDPWAGGDLTVHPGAASARPAAPPPPAPPAAGTRPVPPGGGATHELAARPGTRYETAERRAARLADEQRQHALDAGRRLREMTTSGLRYCPACHEAVAVAETGCPHCGLDLAAYRAERAAPAPRAAPPPRSVLQRFFGRRSSAV